MISKGNVNKVILVGHLGQAPELRHTQKGNPVTTLSLATNRDIKNAEGQIQSEATWHRATVWGKAAENCVKYLTTGSRVYVEGDLRMNTWTDKEGIERRTAEIHVNKVEFLGGGRKPETGAGSGSLAPEEALAVSLAN